jgi:hypothetical protein
MPKPRACAALRGSAPRGHSRPSGGIPRMRLIGHLASSATWLFQPILCAPRACFDEPSGAPRGPPDRVGPPLAMGPGESRRSGRRSRPARGARQLLHGLSTGSPLSRRALAISGAPTKNTPGFAAWSASADPLFDNKVTHASDCNGGCLHAAPAGPGRTGEVPRRHSPAWRQTVARLAWMHSRAYRAVLTV